MKKRNDNKIKKKLKTKSSNLNAALWIDNNSKLSQFDFSFVQIKFLVIKML